MQRRVELFEAPKDILFSLKDISYTPETPRKGEPFTVRGKIELFGIPFLAPIWVIAKVTAPETWWEHYIPIWGSPTKGEGQMALGGDFEITFPKGFDREGEFLLEVEAHPGPTYTLDSITLPPFPPVAKEEMTFIVAGEVPPEEVGFREFRILSYSKNGGPPVTPPGVLELDIGDRCRVNVGFDHRDGVVTGKFHAAIWQQRVWDPHDEILDDEKVFSAPASPDWQPFESYVDIIVTSAISPGSEYGLYVKIMGITGGDIFTEYLANVITIIGVPPTGAFRFSAVIVNGSQVTLTDHDADSGLLLPKTTADYLDITPQFEWQGPAKAAVVSIKAGYRDWTGGFAPKTVAYPASITLPESPEPFQGQLTQAIRIPLTACGGLGDGAVEIVLKIAGMPDYISQIWNVYTTEVAVEERWAIVEEYTTGGHIVSSPLPKRIEAGKWYYDYGTSVTLTAMPSSGYKWVRWKGEVANPNINPTYMIMNQDRGDWYQKIRAEYEIEAVAEAPIITTLASTNILHNSATLIASLARKGYCGIIKCYIEWGTTTAYGYKSPERGMEVGYELKVDITGLIPNTLYHFRAVAVGRCVTPALTGYGSDMTFRTSAEVIRGFTMRVINPPAGATDWIAGAVQGGTLPYIRNRLPIGATWNWTGAVPSYPINFYLMVVDAAGHSLHSMAWDLLLLRAGKNYVYNCATWQMTEA